MIHYDAGLGPERHGHRREKPEIRPRPVAFADLRPLIRKVAGWGQHRFHVDHGSDADHQDLVDLLDAVDHLVVAASPLVTIASDRSASGVIAARTPQEAFDRWFDS